MVHHLMVHHLMVHHVMARASVAGRRARLHRQPHLDDVLVDRGEELVRELVGEVTELLDHLSGTDLVPRTTPRHYLMARFI